MTDNSTGGTTEPVVPFADSDAGQIKALRELVGLLVLSSVVTCHNDISVDHSLVFSEDGDGWNEPYSEDWSCACEEWEGVGWVQVDPACSGRPDHVEVALAWREHFLSRLNDSWDELEACVTPPGADS